ncbi:hypothetical protein DWX90_07370 [Segatella copri]|jgi:hypothetical protein|uniref:Uncharacterized protein n=1 Tax=Segatella copri TaxID=165179 RepID=A0AA93BCW6_9BACT|nr:hypothetical protein DWX90_07370 [Segatella copri]
MFLGKVVAFLRNISFFSLFKSSFIDVEPPFNVYEPPFNVYEPPFNDAERTFNVDERRFLLLVSTKKLRYKSNSY